MAKRRKKRKLGQEARQALSEAGKRGAMTRWGGVAHRPPTKTVRCYVGDVDRLAEVAPRQPDAIRKLLNEHEK